MCGEQEEPRGVLHLQQAVLGCGGALYQGLLHLSLKHEAGEQGVVCGLASPGSMGPARPCHGQAPHTGPPV